MTSLIKNQVLKHLTKFFKDLAPEQLQLSAFKGSCELFNLQLEEKVLMDLLSFPAWLTINKAVCDQLSIKIPWTKIKSVPIQMNLNEVTVEVEVCEEFRDTTTNLEDELQLANIISAQAPGKYGFVDRVIDGITVTVNNVLITFKSKLMSATFNLSRVILESRCPNWKQGELSLTRIKEVTRGQILLFKIVEWQTMRLEAKCLTDPLQAPLRLITNHAQCRLTIKKKLDDCSVIAARIFVIFEDILWVLTFAQFISAASFVEYIFTLIKKSPMSTKTNLLKDNTSNSTSTEMTQPLSSSSYSTATSNQNSSASSSFTSQQTPLISPLHSNQYNVPKATILTGNMSSASLTEQKFLCYDLVETSLHLYIDKVDAHLYDDIEISPTNSSSRDSGGALQTTLDQIQVDCYPYSSPTSDRRHWYKWFDPSPNSRRQWFNSHFAEFDLQRFQKKQRFENLSREASKDTSLGEDYSKISFDFPSVTNEQILSLTVLVKIKDYCMHCVATKHSMKSGGPSKFIQTDKDYHMPSEMPSLYLELNYFYYFDTINRMMIYEDVPDPLAFIHLSPTKLLFDSPTLLFLNSFQVNLSKALVHLNDLFPEETTAPKIHCRIEILMPQISLPAKVSDDQPHANTSTLMVKSGKVTMSNSISDKNVVSKLIDSIEKLRESPSQPINLSNSCSTKKDNSCTGDWNKVWNDSLIHKMNDFSVQKQLWALQFEPVWIDFMNHDVDNLSCNQRLEPIVEPVNAYAFVHLNLSSTFPNSASDQKKKLSLSEVESETISETNKNETMNNKPRDIISILVTVMDGSIMANMDKVQFGFLQRLGMHVEKLFQQIRADASSIIQLDTTVEGSLEIDLTAYIKEIKARLILDKKTEKKRVTAADCLNSQYIGDKIQNSPEVSGVKSPSCMVVSSEIGSNDCSSTIDSNKNIKSNIYFQNTKPILNVTNHPYTLDNKGPKDSLLGVVYTPGCEQQLEGDADLLDECVEVADDASYLFLGEGGGDAKTASTTNSLPPVIVETKKDQNDLRDTKKSPGGESLLINLDEMEDASSLFAKVSLQSSSPQYPSQDAKTKQQEIETESISYLELSMGQLMVRRITETKRRQKF